MTTTSTTVRREIVVPVPQDAAFDAFTSRFGEFQPSEHSLLEASDVETVFEARAGGHIYDRAPDGTECRWARVLALEPPDRLMFSWDITTRWQVETDPTRASEVEVRFVPEDSGGTRAILEHRHLDRHGEGWEGMRAGVDGDDGWPLYLERFAALLG